MYVCVCRKVTDREIKQAIQEGCNTLDALSETLQVATECGACSCHAEELLEEFACPAICLRKCLSRGDSEHRSEQHGCLPARA